MQPPVAKTIAHERVHHGETVDDPYFWLADKENKDVIAYLEAENAWFEAAMAGPSPNSRWAPATSRNASSREMPSTIGV